VGCCDNLLITAFDSLTSKAHHYAHCVRFYTDFPITYIFYIICKIAKKEPA